MPFLRNSERSLDAGFYLKLHPYGIYAIHFGLHAVKSEIAMSLAEVQAAEISLFTQGLAEQLELQNLPLKQ